MVNGINQNQTVGWQPGKAGGNETQKAAKERTVAEPWQASTEAQMPDPRPEYDEYVSSDGEADMTPGLYRLDTDESGNQKIVFTPPGPMKDMAAGSLREQAAEAGIPDDNTDANNQNANKPISRPATYSMTAHGDTSQVKAEIARIKEKKVELSQQLQKTGDEDQRRNLEAQLAQIDAELAMKDNPEYIKRNAKRTNGPVIRES